MAIILPKIVVDPLTRQTHSTVSNVRGNVVVIGNFPTDKLVEQVPGTQDSVIKYRPDVANSYFTKKDYSSVNPHTIDADKARYTLTTLKDAASGYVVADSPLWDVFWDGSGNKYTSDIVSDYLGATISDPLSGDEITQLAESVIFLNLATITRNGDGKVSNITPTSIPTSTGEVQAIIDKLIDFDTGLLEAICEEYYDILVYNVPITYAQSPSGMTIHEVLNDYIKRQYRRKNMIGINIAIAYGNSSLLGNLSKVYYNNNNVIATADVDANASLKSLVEKFDMTVDKSKYSELALKITQDILSTFGTKLYIAIVQEVIPFESNTVLPSPANKAIDLRNVLSQMSGYIAGSSIRTSLMQRSYPFFAQVGSAYTYSLHEPDVDNGEVLGGIGYELVKAGALIFRNKKRSTYQVLSINSLLPVNFVIENGEKVFDEEQFDLGHIRGKNGFINDLELDTFFAKDTDRTTGPYAELQLRLQKVKEDYVDADLIKTSSSATYNTEIEKDSDVGVINVVLDLIMSALIGEIRITTTLHVEQ
jgi:hypothetical protein